ncbi:glycosyl transferase [Nocardia transvalensis]|nr:glycosyl transferase [Nocardia transvalensis]
MRSYHLLVTVVGGTGHVFPALGTVSELVRMGHRVTVVTSADFADAVSGAGAALVTYRSAFEDFHVPDVMDAENAEELLNNVYIEDNEAILRAAEQAAELDKPDAVLYDVFHFIAGKLLATKLNCPGVRLSPIFAANETYSVWEHLRQNLNQGYPEDFDSTREHITRLLAEFGVDETIRQFWDGIDDFNIVSIPRSFQIAEESFDERFVFTGPTIETSRLDQQEWRPPPGDPQILLVSLGSTWNEHPDFFQACVRAFDGTPWHVVLVIGERLDPAVLGELPPNIEVHQWISFLDVLRYASVFVTQGSTGAVMESLYRGCPMLLFSHFTAEAEVSAGRVVEMGLGRALAADIGAEELRKAVSDIAADEEVRRRIEDIRREIHGSGGAARAAVEIVDYIGRSS